MTKKYFFMLIIFASLFFIPRVSSGTTITLQPGPDEGNDAYIGSRYPNEVYGSHTGYVSYTSGGTCESLVQFNIPAGLYGATVENAQLSIVGAVTGYGVGQFYGIGIYKIISEWNESSVTWNNRPGHDDSTGLSTQIPTNVYQEFSFDITDIVKSWLSADPPNYGVIFVPEHSLSGGGLWFRFSEFGLPMGSPTNRPKLTIDYTPVPEPSAFLIIASGLMGIGFLRKRFKN